MGRELVNAVLESARNRDWLTVEAPKHALMQWWNGTVVPDLKRALLKLPKNVFDDVIKAARDVMTTLTVDDIAEESAAVKEKRQALTEALEIAEGMVGKGW